MAKYDKKDLLYGLILVLFVFLTRYIFSVNENVEFSSDTGHIAMGSQLYSLPDYAPHLPGYYLYVKIVKMLTYLTTSPQMSMLWLSIFFSVAGAVFFYRIARYYTDQLNAFLLTLLIFTNPFVWFHGCIYEIYSFDLFFSSVLIFAGMNSKWIYSTPPILALGLGIRATSGILLLPVLCFLWYQHYKKQGIYWNRLAEFSSLALVLFLMWLIPMIRSVGGLQDYLNLWSTHYPFIPMGTAFNLSVMVANTWYIILPFVVILAYFVFRVIKGSAVKFKTFGSENRNDLIIMLLWLVPALLVFIFAIYHKGYFLICTGVLFMFYLLITKYGILNRKLIISLIVLQSALFFLFPYNEPSDEVNFNAETREMSKFEAWQERLMSGFSMSYNRILAYNEYYSEVITGLKNSRDFMVAKKKYFYMLDPSCLVFARGLQSKFPQKTLTVLNIYDMKTYFSYNENELRLTTDPYYMIKNSLIITRRSFYEKYLIGIAVPIKEYKNYVFVEGTEKNGLQLLEIYNKYYQKSGT